MICDKRVNRHHPPVEDTADFTVTCYPSPLLVLVRTSIGPGAFTAGPVVAA
jgi:hypothetical protein